MNEAERAGLGVARDSDVQAWLTALRQRLQDVAGRRVEVDALEDVVQDTLRVVLERIHAGDGPGSRPSLAWCFQTLRNVIGDHYRRSRRTRGRRADLAEGVDIPAGDPDPIEAFGAAEIVEVVEQALEAMAARDGGCARYLRQLGAGIRPAELARAERVSEAVLYRRVYRCRQKLRALLLERGVEA
jgi:RNA polymerase sigma factor (sigma-70 family)